MSYIPCLFSFTSSHQLIPSPLFPPSHAAGYPPSLPPPYAPPPTPSIHGSLPITLVYLQNPKVPRLALSSVELDTLPCH